MTATLLTLDEAAPVLRRSVSATRKLIRRDPRLGAIARKIGGRVLISADDLDQYIASAPRFTPKPSRARRFLTPRPVAAIKRRLVALAEEVRA